jgi:hypothetical protein
MIAAEEFIHDIGANETRTTRNQIFHFVSTLAFRIEDRGEKEFLPDHSLPNYLELQSQILERLKSVAEKRQQQAADRQEFGAKAANDCVISVDEW